MQNKYRSTLLTLITGTALLLAGCQSFPNTVQDEAQPLGTGNLRMDAVTVLNNFGISLSAGITPSTDVWLQIGDELSSLGVKQTLVYHPNQYAFALLGSGFASHNYTNQNGSGRDTGYFVGAIGNWYRGDFNYALQLRQIDINYHRQFRSDGLFSGINDDFQQYTTLSATVRWRKPENRFSLKGGIECNQGHNALPDQPGFQSVPTAEDACGIVLGYSYYTAR